MNLQFKSLLAAGLLGGVAARGATTHYTPLALEGQTFIHDPSTIVQDGARYYVFGTGPGIRSKSSPDLIHWTNGPSVFAEAPGWTFKTVSGFRGHFWAPDVIRLNGKFFLYYAVSTWGKQVSAIGLATSPTLDPTATNYAWTDCGPVITSTNGSPFNAIDPSVFHDDDGRLWLAFGSYWRGIYLTELNPQTGKRIAADSPLYPLAWHSSIEAACLMRHGNFYYLFVNWGQCCEGTNSTYEVRVGRAEKITGPYLDRDGNNLLAGGGTLFLKSRGRFIGPGHIGIVSGSTPNGATWFSYHYYDAATQGRSRLAIGQMDWSNGWPVAVSAQETSAMDATNDWKLVWSDEFNVNGPPNPANWNFERGFVRNEELQWYQPENAYCTNGLLVIEARRERIRNPTYDPASRDWRRKREWADYTSASLTTRGLHEFKYGKFEMRARIDPRLGSWPAFWALGATPGRRWPACGEVDIMEYYTNVVLANVAYSFHGRAKFSAPWKSLAALGGDDWAKAFHVWTMEWDKNKIDLRLDGQLMNHFDLTTADVADTGNPFHAPFYLILNQAIGGTRGGDPSQTKFPIRFEVDWVRVYQRAK